MKTINNFNNRNITKPKNPKLKYDFDFKRKEDSEWRYLNSSDNIEKFNEQIKSILELDGEFRIINAKTGKIIPVGFKK